MAKILIGIIVGLIVGLIVFFIVAWIVGDTFIAFAPAISSIVLSPSGITDDTLFMNLLAFTTFIFSAIAALGSFVGTITLITTT